MIWRPLPPHRLFHYSSFSNFDRAAAARETSANPRNGICKAAAAVKVRCETPVVDPAAVGRKKVVSRLELSTELSAGRGLADRPANRQHLSHFKSWVRDNATGRA
jgi:hypothetical protein